MWFVAERKPLHCVLGALAPIKNLTCHNSGHGVKQLCFRHTHQELKILSNVPQYLFGLLRSGVPHARAYRTCLARLRKPATASRVSPGGDSPTLKEQAPNEGHPLEEITSSTKVASWNMRRDTKQRGKYVYQQVVVGNCSESEAVKRV